uniref:Uncharacterized protein n=1 Tax=Glossina morsitans morsitans TaxID=37546 RepID=A0A1B0G7P3_GLOMM
MSYVVYRAFCSIEACQRCILRLILIALEISNPQQDYNCNKCTTSEEVTRQKLQIFENESRTIYLSSLGEEIFELCRNNIFNRYLNVCNYQQFWHEDVSHGKCCLNKLSRHRDIKFITGNGNLKVMREGARSLLLDKSCFTLTLFESTYMILTSPLSIVETKYSTLLINELIVISFVPASVGRCATVGSDWVELVVSVAQYTHSLAVLAAAPFLLVVPLTGPIFEGTAQKK